MTSIASVLVSFSPQTESSESSPAQKRHLLDHASPERSRVVSQGGITFLNANDGCRNQASNFCTEHLTSLLCIKRDAFPPR
mmetsp:Transcript_11493/g.43138  ORF Transcript_11493/g.43138 Transcript_11493/m.43138 type:complete len:81 (-) Transcript_11493:1704-1946(-)